MYLRHLKVGDTLILEEPEAHLHPAMQRRFTEEIVSWVRAGIRVILTTHSEWVLEELSTIVALGEGGKGSVNGVETLTAKEVGVWLFDPADRMRPEKGSEVREVLWNRDEGGYEVGFYDIAAVGHNQLAEAIELSSDWSASR